MLQVSRRPATYTELLLEAKAAGLGWFTSRILALLGRFDGAQVVTIGRDERRPQPPHARPGAAQVSADPAGADPDGRLAMQPHPERSTHA